MCQVAASLCAAYDQISAPSGQALGEEEEGATTYWRQILAFLHKFLFVAIDENPPGQEELSTTHHVTFSSHKQRSNIWKIMC